MPQQILVSPLSIGEMAVTFDDEMRVVIFLREDAQHVFKALDKQNETFDAEFTLGLIYCPTPKVLMLSAFLRVGAHVYAGWLNFCGPQQEWLCALALTRQDNIRVHFVNEAGTYASWPVVCGTLSTYAVVKAMWDYQTWTEADFSRAVDHVLGNFAIPRLCLEALDDDLTLRL